MPTLYTLADASRLLPEARARIEELAETAERAHALVDLVASGQAPAGTKAEAKAAEAAADEQLEWFLRRGIQVKDLDPPLLDFPARVLVDGSPEHVLLCWRGGEDDIVAFHRPEDGFAGRQPVSDLDEP